MALTDKKKSVKEENIETRDNSLIEKENPEHGAVEHPVEENIDGVIDLTATRRKRFHVNRDAGNGGILELNTSDMGIISRLEQLYPRLQKLSQEAAVQKLGQQETEDKDILAQTVEALNVIDAEMRNIIDEIFDSNVSEVCAPQGTMVDPFNGEFRFEHIINKISELYETNVNTEFKKMAANIKKKTSKYTKKGK